MRSWELLADIEISSQKIDLGFVGGLASRRKSARHNSNRVKVMALIIIMLTTLSENDCANSRELARSDSPVC